MPDDKDFKRLVRQRMVKTGESYTTARARLRPPAKVALATLLERAGLEGLGDHLETAHGIEVRKISELDLGVFRVDRHDGRSWVARVFPASRTVRHVEGDAEVLRFLAAQGLAVERLAADPPVSVHEGQGVLVTEHISGTNARHDASGPTMLALGATLGAIHNADADQAGVTRQAGGWHHIVPNGGTVRDAARAVLGELDTSDSSDEMRFLRAQLDAVPAFDELPQALVHPDPCGANAVTGSDGAPVLIDWTGAGRGARLVSLAALLAGSLQPVPGVAPARTLRPIDAIMVGYRSQITLVEDELEALPGALAAGWIVLGAWMHLFQDVPAKQIAGGIADRLNLADRVSRRVRETFALDDDELTRWFKGAPPVSDPAQAALF